MADNSNRPSCLIRWEQEQARLRELRQRFEAADRRFQDWARLRELVERRRLAETARAMGQAPVVVKARVARPEAGAGRGET
jgi:hypothetical protein